MVGLVDSTAAIGKSVSVGAEEIPVYGVSASGIAYLFQRFPELRAVFVGRELDAERLIGMGGQIVASVIACGCGYVNDAKAEEVAERLPAEAQLDLIAEIIKLTMPSGVGPFVEKVFKIIGGGESQSFMELASKLPRQSMNSSGPDIPAGNA
jgi:hypothetical protein